MKPSTKYLIVTALITCFISVHTMAQKKKASAKQDFTISGNIIGLDTGRAMLMYDYNDKTVIDTVKIEKGIFKFAGKINGPTFARFATTDFKLMHDQYIDPTNMQLTAIKDSIGSVQFSGSPTEDEAMAFRKAMDPLQNQVFEVRQKMFKLSETDSLGAEKMQKEELEPLFAKIDRQSLEYVKKHPKSIVALYKLGDILNAGDAKELLAAYTVMDKSLKESAVGKKVGMAIDSKIKTEIGAQAMNFIQNDVNGNPVSLESFKGKYVLLDFWASWCGPCRMENPNLVKSYKAYKDKGFTILGVSLDRDSTKWKEAIQKDQLTWTHVSDLQFWQNAVAVKYGISAVPANFLINTKGIIIARNLRAEALEAKLAELFKQ